ncbi:hypothetical protein [Streptomyces atroolivaceus]|uniref:hypothetical protein n=1 Tax=Streptomyces atroolivaceus TaxID=66869 RepID=UPI0036CCD968
MTVVGAVAGAVVGRFALRVSDTDGAQSAAGGAGQVRDSSRTTVALARRGHGRRLPVLASPGALGIAPARQSPPGAEFRVTPRRGAAAKAVPVGGDIAGLVGPYEMGVARRACAVLEARGRAGGRGSTVRRSRSGHRHLW